MTGREPGIPSQIVLGEDNPADVYLIRQALDEHKVNYDLRVAVHGGEVMEILAGPSNPTPDLIVLDLNLPRYEGLEVLKMIRESAQMSHIPVVILTSSDSPKDRLAASALGATCYIRKPSSLDEFMNIGKTLQGLLTHS